MYIAVNLFNVVNLYNDTCVAADVSAMIVNIRIYRVALFSNKGIIKCCDGTLLEVTAHLAGQQQ